MTQLQIRLYRDSFSTPWGFRLQGGKDLGQPLSVQRVFSNSPAEGELQRGDLILAIGGRDGNELTHKQALDLIKHGGGQIQLDIRRPAPGQVPVTSPVSIKPQRPRAPALQLSPVHPSASHQASPAKSYQRSPEAAYASNSNNNPRYNPCYNPNFPQQYSKSPQHNPPRWAAQTLSPKKVSKLSRLGGGGKDFGVDYGALYGTVPRRRRHSTEVDGLAVNLQSPGANPVRVASLSHLGGGGFQFGTDYCTLPKRNWRHKSQPPPSSQQQQPTSYGFQPKKINLSSLGGGGPSFGTDYSGAGGGGYRPVTQPMHVHTASPKSPGHNVEMLSKVQESLDNISLSPRTPDYGGYQGPPTFYGSPGGGGGGGGGEQYVSTGVRLDMEREQELKRQQYLRNNPPYVPTAVRIDQQMVASGKNLSPRSPVAGSQGPSSSPSWNLPQQGSNDAVDGGSGPAWKSTLKPSVKPWDVDLDYVPGSQHQAPRATGFSPAGGGAAAVRTAPQAAPYSPVPPPTEQEGGGGGGPKVLHLQYNSPMGLYSNQNIQETYAGQTKAMAASGALSPGGTPMAQNGRPEDRDWNRSELCRMIQEDERRGGGGSHQPSANIYQQPNQYQQPIQYQQQHYKAPPPPSHYSAPRPQPVQSYQPSFGTSLDEFGTSDF